MTDEADTKAAAAAPEAAEASVTPTSNLEIVAPAGGQIALTAHNNEDGTWSITRGPGGRVLADGLPREAALAIVGAPSEPGYEPQTEQERRVVEARRQIEKEAADFEVQHMNQSDADVAANGIAIAGDGDDARPAKARRRTGAA